MEEGFNSKKYIVAQKKEIKNRINKFKKLYLEIGGKLVYDNHAARVLPGYKNTNKIDLLKKLHPLDIIYCLNAKDLQSKRTLTIKEKSYQEQTLKDLTDIKKHGLKVSYIVITRYTKEIEANKFKEILEKKGYTVFVHNEIKRYGVDLEETMIGLFKQWYIPVTKKLVLITGPASNSGKMAVALSQIYYETRNHIKTGYAKFETFPIHNLPIGHPINIAYEAATADLQDKNQIDPFHKRAYNVEAINYNRDIENFSILQEILKKVTKKKIPFGYRSPTDMGVNMVKVGINNNNICEQAAIQEIFNRHNRYLTQYKRGKESFITIKRINELIQKV